MLLKKCTLRTDLQRKGILEYSRTLSSYVWLYPLCEEKFLYEKQNHFQ